MSATLEAGFKSNARHVVGYCREKLHRYGANIAAGFWITGNVAMIAASHAFGTGLEMLGGLTLLAASATAGFAGHMRYGAPCAVMLSTWGYTLQQANFLSEGAPGTWIGWLPSTMSGLLVVAEPIAAAWARNKLDVVGSIQQSTAVTNPRFYRRKRVRGRQRRGRAPKVANPDLGKTWLRNTRCVLAHYTREVRQKSAKAVFWLISYPRASYSIVNSASMVPVAISDMIHERYHMLPIYVLWAIGNGCFSLSRPTEQPPPRVPVPIP